MRKIFSAMLSAMVVMLLGFGASAQDSVIIIRHGEKPKKGDNLNCKGLNRALAIPKVLVGRYGVPAYIYVPKMATGNTTKHSRMFQTVTPLAARYNIAIDSKYNETDSNKLAKDVEHKKGLVLIVWQHHNIAPVARALGVPASEAPDWSGSDFDSIWIITNPGKKTAKLTIAHEDLNGVSDQCP